jgi:hypothetical protein
VSTAEEHERPGTVLRGRALPAARAAWVALVATVLALFVTGIPASYRTARVLRPETVAGLEHLGVPTGLPAAYLTILDTVTMLGFAGIAVLIFARRSDDWIAMLMALTLVLTAMLYTAPAFEAPAPVPLVAMLCALGEICQLAVVYLFPSGRFVPRWIWILLVPLVVWRPAIWTLSYIPGYLASSTPGSAMPTSHRTPATSAWCSPCSRSASSPRSTGTDTSPRRSSDSRPSGCCSACSARSPSPAGTSW